MIPTWLFVLSIVFVFVTMAFTVAFGVRDLVRLRRLRNGGSLAIALALLAIAFPAHAQAIDPSPVVAALLPLLPASWAIWVGDALTIAAILSMLASVLSAAIKPPSATAASWLRVVYAVLTWPALNLGWARNAVVPGMHPQVREAAIVSAKLAAAAPELAQVVEAPGIKGAVVPGASA